MKLYTGMGPNPRVVTIAIAELGADVEQVPVDLMSGENRGEEHLKRNPAGQLPTLELDDGTCIADSLTRSYLGVEQSLVSTRDDDCSSWQPRTSLGPSTLRRCVPADSTPRCSWGCPASARAGRCWSCTLRLVPCGRILTSTYSPNSWMALVLNRREVITL